jgi:hypothetical protein
MIDSTNLIVQARCRVPHQHAQQPDPLPPFGSVTLPYQTISAELSMTETNIVTDQTFRRRFT